MSEQPTWTKKCSCGSMVERWSGQGEVSCCCGAEFNAFGQQLRSDWRRNPSSWDDDVEDLEGFELAQLRVEAGW